MDKKIKGGVVGDLIQGTGGLIVGVIIILVIVSTILGANLLRSTEKVTSATETNVGINDTGLTLAVYNGLNYGYGITSIVNATGGETVTAYLFNSISALLKNSTAVFYNDVNVSYTYYIPTAYEQAGTDMSGNFTKGIQNVSSKIPTILLIGAVVLLFGVIVLLIRQSEIMGIGGPGRGSL